MLMKIDKIIETDIPTLISGWAKVKELYPNQKITNKEITDKLFWTFSEKEKRTENGKDIENFKKYCINRINSKYKYYFINPFNITINKVKKLIFIINQLEKDKFYYFDGKHFFILVDDCIFGVNFDFLFNSRITTDRLEKWLKNKKFEIIKNFKIFNIEELKNKKHLIPILGKEEYEKQFIIGYIFE